MMHRLTTDTPKNNFEMALNLFYVKDKEVWVREYILRSIAIAKLTALEVIDPFATIADAKRVLADMAAADVAPVVRCRDCEYARDLGF